MFSLCLRRFSVGTLASSNNPKDMQVRLTGDSKLAVGVNVSVSGCLSLYVGPVTDWQPVQGVPSWDQLQHPREHPPVLGLGWCGQEVGVPRLTLSTVCRGRRSMS